MPTNPSHLSGPPDFGRSFSEEAKMSKRLIFRSVADLTDALIRAKDAHGEFERTLSQPDKAWPYWYAQFMFDEVHGCAGSKCRLARVVTPQTSAPEVPVPEIDGVIQSSTDSTDYWDRH